MVPPKCVCRRQPYPGPGGGHQSLFHLSINANTGAAAAPKDNGINQTIDIANAYQDSTQAQPNSSNHLNKVVSVERLSSLN